MHKIKANIESFETIWKYDLGLVALSHPNLDINWASQRPTSQELLSILKAKSAQYENPVDPLELTDAILTETLDFLVPQIEKEFGCKLREKPAVEIVPVDRYLPRINELERKTDAHSGVLFQAPPGMYHSAHHKVIVVPEKVLLRVPRGPTCDVYLPCDVVERTWDKSYFEEILCEEVAHSVFRQLRGEWGEAYVNCMKSVGLEGRGSISSVNEAMAQYVKENIASDQRPQWGLYVVGDKLTVWQDNQRMHNYLGIRALSPKRKLAQISMVDYFSVQGLKGVYVSFIDAHPNHAFKRRKFNNQAFRP